jgi:lysophospholipase L1-like esterase
MRHAVLRLIEAAVLALVLAATLAPAADAPPAWRLTAEALRPFWLSDAMHGESVLFTQDDPAARPHAPLAFEPTRILAVRDPSGAITYQEGRDYVVRAGTREIELPPGSAIAYKAPSELRRAAGTQRYALTHRDGNGEIFFGGGHEYHDMQCTVSYEYNPDAWTGPRPAFSAARLPRSIARLGDRQPLRIVLVGDSISTGCNASGWSGVAPFQPPYHELLVLNLQAACGAPVTLVNLAVGGTDTAWGLGQIDRVTQAEPDLVILAFGMNDSAGRPAAEYKANITAMIAGIAQARPETEFILVASMLGNRDWTRLHHEYFPQYRDALAELCRPGVALADMTALWEELLERKRDWDLTGNGVNHPNDFGHRLYAQVLSALLVPPAP